MCCEPRRYHYTSENECNRCFRTSCFSVYVLLFICGIIGGIILLALGGTIWYRRESSRLDMINNYRNLVEDHPNEWLDMTNPSSTTPRPSASVFQVPATAYNMTRQSAIVIPLSGLSTGGNGKNNNNDNDNNNDRNYDAVQAYPTEFLGATVFPYVSDKGMTLTLSTNGIVTDTMTVALPFAKQQIQGIECTLEACVDDCNHEGNRKCTAASLQRVCQSKYGAARYYGQDSCNGFDECGSCHFETYLSKACFVVSQDTTVSPSTYVFDRNMASCFYPFLVENQEYARSSNSSEVQVVVQLRSRNDAFIYLQAATKGSMQFPNRGDDLTTPGVLVGLGIALLLSFSIGMCCVKCCNKRRQQEGVAPEIMPPQSQSRAELVEMNTYPTSGRGPATPAQFQAPRTSAVVEGVVYDQPDARVVQVTPIAPPPAYYIPQTGAAVMVPAEEANTIREDYPGVPRKSPFP